MAIYNIGGLDVNTSDLTVDDMPTEIFREIFDICGVDIAISLLVNMTGNLIQVPTNGFLKIQKKVVMKEYDGTTASIRRLSRKFKISESFIRNILEENKIPIPADGQIGLFDKNEDN